MTVTAGASWQWGWPRAQGRDAGGQGRGRRALRCVRSGRCGWARRQLSGRGVPLRALPAVPRRVRPPPLASPFRGPGCPAAGRGHSKVLPSSISSCDRSQGEVAQMLSARLTIRTANNSRCESNPNYADNSQLYFRKNQ